MTARPTTPAGPGAATTPQSDAQRETTGRSSACAAVLAGHVLDVAPALLGSLVSSHLPDGVVTIRLTEVEAYDGAQDPGSHAFRGSTPRNEIMFGPAGHLYVYRHLGLHHCANVVTGVVGSASAVLMRAGEVVEGAELAAERRRRRGVIRAPVDLARGPARLAVALGLDLSHYGADLLDPAGPVRIRLARDLPHPVPEGVRTGPRVGVAGPGGDAEAYPWRFWLSGEPTVSAYRPGAVRRRPASG